MFNRILWVLLLLCFLLGGYVAFTAVTLPNVRVALERGIQPMQTSQILARDQTLLMAYGKFKQERLPISEIPPQLIEALLATEDRRFYQHKGIDPIGILRALVQDVSRGGMHEGGSTITQQLARNVFLTNERSLQRKVKEALLAIKLEQQLRKDQILELYLNNVYFGEGAYGVGAASAIYFGKPPRKLSLGECALLAGLPQAPSRYSPFANPDLARKRQLEVLRNLQEVGKLTPDAIHRVANEPFRLNPHGQSLSSADKAPFFNRAVIQEVLERLDMDEQTFWQQGLRVYTTLDARAQATAETQVQRLSTAYGRTRTNQQAALIALDTQGRIVAYVGGKNFARTQFDRVSQARRQAGSLFKVFVYTAAIQRGKSPLTVYRDEPVTFGTWTPANYDKRHHGYMTMAQALAKSNNIIAVKLLHELSPEVVINVAQKMGLSAPMQPNLSLALGASDVTLKEMTAAFGILNNNGIAVPPYAIDRILDRDGRILFQHKPEKHKVLERTTRDTMVGMMRGVVRFGTGKAADIGRDAAGKTGTSDDYRDAWFIGFTPEVTTGVWVGNDNNAQMPGIAGGGLPARIWQAFMARYLGDLPKQMFDLSYGEALETKDFFVYNLDHLSESERRPSDEEQMTGDVPSEETENPEGVLDPGQADPTTTTETVPPQELPLPGAGSSPGGPTGASLPTSGEQAPTTAPPQQQQASHQYYVPPQRSYAPYTERYTPPPSSTPQPPPRYASPGSPPPQRP